MNNISPCFGGERIKLKNMETKKIEIEIPEGKRAEWINGVLTLVDEVQKDTHSVTERIQTFEDARSELGSAHPLVEEYETITCRCGGLSTDILAYMKLRIICAALNEGWEPKFTKDENCSLDVSEEEKQKLIDALKVSKEPKAKEYLKRFFGIEVKPEYNFKPFDKVLVRDEDGIWFADIFSHYTKDSEYEYKTAGGGSWEYCIPYNDQTAHLLGTTENWEE